MKKRLKNASLQELASTGILGICALFAAYFSAKWLIINADATSGVYLWKDGFAWGDILIADWHTNLLKLPLSFLQAHMPFTLTTFVIVNAALLFFMMFGWAMASTLTLGRKYFVPMTLVLSFLLAGSAVLPTESAFTTIRNIEYPLYFLLVILFWRLYKRLQAVQQLSSMRLPVALYIVIMGLLQASDPFFVYATIPPTLVVLYMLGKTHGFKKPQLISSLVLLIAPFILAKLLVFTIFKTGAFKYYGETMNPTLYGFNELPGTLWSGIHDLILLFNGDFFGNPLSIQYADQIIMFVFCIAALYGYYIAWKHIRITIAKNPPLATLVIATGLLFTLYISFTAFDHQIRFLVLMGLTMCTTLIAWLSDSARVRAVLRKPLVRSHGLYLAAAAIVLMLALAYNGLRLSNFYGLVRQKSNIVTINAYLEAKGVNTVVAGHSYGSTLSFWTNGNLQYIPVLYCNQNLPFLTRESWYQPTSDTSKNIALIVDKDGRDANSWNCNHKQIRKYYGKPLSRKAFQGIDNKTVEVYIYPKDRLGKIKFIQSKGVPKSDFAH